VLKPSVGAAYHQCCTRICICYDVFGSDGKILLDEKN